MKKFNNFIFENDNNPNNDTIKTTDGLDIPKQAVINMIGKIFSSDNDDDDNIKTGGVYLNKTKQGNTPVKVLSLTNPVKKDSSNKYIPGKNLNTQSGLTQGNVFVQTINKTNDGKGILGGTKSNSIAVPKDKLEKLPDEYNYSNYNTDVLLQKYQKGTDKEKSDIYQYIINKINKKLNDINDNTEKIKTIDSYIKLNNHQISELDNYLENKKKELQ